MAGAGVPRDADEAGGVTGQQAGLTLHPQGSRKAKLLQKLLAVAAVRAEGIGKGIGAAAGHLLDAVLCLLQVGAHGGKILLGGFVPALGGTPAGRTGFVQVVGVVLDLHQPAFPHLVHHIPRHMGIAFLILIQAAVFIGLPHDDGKDGLHTVFLQQRVSVQVIIIVAVIKGEHDRLFRQRGAVPHIGDDLPHGDGMAALPLQKEEVLLQRLRGDDIVPRLLGVGMDAVVHQHRQPLFLWGGKLPHGR